MTKVELVPTLSHCIETVAKEEYRRSVKAYLRKGEEDKELEERIELLRRFLESVDFRELRKESEKYLMEGQQVKFWLRSKEDSLKYELKVG